MAQPLVAADGCHADALGHGIQLVQALGRDDLEPFALEILRADTAGVAQHLNAREVFLSEAGHAVFTKQEAEYLSGRGFRLFSMLTLAFLQMGILEM